MALAPPTQVRIYNRTLALLGSVSRVVNVDDGQAVTEALNALWPDAVRELLAEHPWNCAIRMARLNLLPATPAFGSGALYQLPTDCLRWLPWATGECDWFDGTVVANRQILVEGGGGAAAAQINVRYIALVDDPSAWSPHMVTAMGHLLAWHAAEPITQSASIATKMKEAWHGYDEESGALARAKEKDGLETGGRSRGNVEAYSRALTAARTPFYRAPGR